MCFLWCSLVGVFLLVLMLLLLVMVGNMVCQVVEVRLGDQCGFFGQCEQVLIVEVVMIEVIIFQFELIVFGELCSCWMLLFRLVMGGMVIYVDLVLVDGGVVIEGQLIFKVDLIDVEIVFVCVKVDLQDVQVELNDV